MKHKHRGGSRAENGWNTAPVLVFAEWGHPLTSNWLVITFVPSAAFGEILRRVAW
ncbi:MAG: hypothetical protein ABI790_09855 [Betaproteobacteria bacterium]